MSGEAYFVLDEVQGKGVKYILYKYVWEVYAK